MREANAVASMSRGALFLPRRWFSGDRLLIGLGAGAMLPAASALVAEVAPRERRNLY
jgi:MFS family permease